MHAQSDSKDHLLYVQGEYEIPENSQNQKKQANSKKAALLQSIQMQMPAPKPNATLAGIIHGLVILSGAFMSLYIYKSDAYPILQLVNEHKSNPLDSFLGTDTGCLAFLNDIYMVVPIAAIFAGWALISFLIVATCGTGGCWALFQTLVLGFNAIVTYNDKTNPCASDYRLLSQYVNLPPPGYVYYFAMCVGSVLMIIAGVLYNRAQKALIQQENQKRSLLQASLLASF